MPAKGVGQSPHSCDRLFDLGLAKMTVERLLSIIVDLSAPNGRAQRNQVQEVYGLGFSGAIKDASDQGLVDNASDGTISVTAASPAPAVG